MFFMLASPMAAVRTDIKERIRRPMRQAISRVYDSDKAACAEMDVKQSHYSEEMAGERPLNLDSKTNLDIRVWSWFAFFLIKEFGMPEDEETLQRIRIRMARMDMDAPARERSA